ncbi:MAG: haloacid dehalogenase type II [Acidobacteriaceae bacterium]
MFSKSKSKVGSVLVFDVNETLLDVQALRPHFERIFKDGAVLKEWFAQMLLYSQTVTQTGQYVDFGKLARAGLKMVAEIHDTDLTEDDVSGVMKDIASLPPHTDVVTALHKLHAKHFYIVALTNSAESVAKQQIEHAGLRDMFERVFSVDSVSKFKPAAEAYRYVADQLDVTTSELTMIAAHPWDLMGAKAAGCQIALLQRPGTAWFPLSPEPALTSKTLTGLADQLIAREQHQ